MSGITPEGFDRKTLEQILSSIQASQRGVFGDTFDAVSVNTPEGQLNGIFSSHMAEAWELLEELSHGMDPDAAAAYLLTALAALTGTTRRGAEASVSERQRLNINAGATVPAGTLIAHSARPDILFATDADVTNGGGAAANFEVTATCTQTGPIGAIAGSLTVIVNTVAGLNSTTNLEDATLGRVADSDTTLRQRREDQLALRGGSTISAIRADLLELEGVNAADVLENTTDATVDGMPPHSIEAVIDDGNVPSVDDDAIAQIIWDSKPGGVQTTGSDSGTAVDATGADQTVYFSRVTYKPVYITLQQTTDGDFPVDGQDQTKDAIVAYGQENFALGDTVIALGLRASALITGVSDVPIFTLGFAPAPVGTANLAIAQRERSYFDISLITFV
jgi:uncharacterized phage protein gp47/JayE